MGAYILCQVRRAENPYYIENISLNIYSIEELCYFICHNLPLVDESVLNERLISWLREELHLRHLAQKLSQLSQREFSFEEFIFPILREVNYLNAAEMRALGLKSKEMESQSASVRLKMKGDALVVHKKYIKAIDAYKAAMNQPGEMEENVQFAGSIYNNMGCVYARLFQMEEACDCFRKAYEDLHTGMTLKSYLFAVYMKDGEEAYEQLGEELGVDPGTRAEMDRQIAAVVPEEIPKNLEQALTDWTREYHRNTGL